MRTVWFRPGCVWSLQFENPVAGFIIVSVKLPLKFTLTPAPLAVT